MNSCEQRVCSEFLCGKMDTGLSSGDPTPGDTSKPWVPISHGGDLGSAALCHAHARAVNYGMVFTCLPKARR